MGRMLNVKEVADRTQISVSTLRKYTMLKRIPYKKFGYKVLFDSDEIELWIKANSFGLESIAEVRAGGTGTATASAKGFAPAPADGALFPVVKRGK